jgi:acylphosphatase
MKAVEARVSGRVQGVFYRASAKAQADGLGIKGWARNMADGSVRLFLQHEDQRTIDEMLAWSTMGPPGAEVGRLDACEANPDWGLTGFEVR